MNRCNGICAYKSKCQKFNIKVPKKFNMKIIVQKIKDNGIVSKDGEEVVNIMLDGQKVEQVTCSTFSKYLGFTISEN